MLNVSALTWWITGRDRPLLKVTKILDGVCCSVDWLESIIPQPMHRGYEVKSQPNFVVSLIWASEKDKFKVKAF